MRHVQWGWIVGFGVALGGPSAWAQEETATQSSATPEQGAEAMASALAAPVAEAPVAAATSDDPSTLATASGRGLGQDSATRGEAEVLRAMPVGLHKDTKETEAQTELSGTWEIELTPMSGEKPPFKEVLQFERGKVTAERLASDGYPSSSFTLTVGGDGIPVWETMQTKAEEGVVFWRGELRGEIMTGILSKHSLEGATEDYNFVGRRRSASAPSAAGAQGATVQVAAAATTAEPVQPTVSSDATSKKKKKKGWW